jgi:hypothetical protein
MSLKIPTVLLGLLFAGTALTGCAGAKDHSSMMEAGAMGGGPQAGCKMMAPHAGAVAPTAEATGHGKMNQDKKQMMAKMDCAMMGAKAPAADGDHAEHHPKP